MSAKRVLFLGGNGHCEARLDPARASLKARGSDLELVDAHYPGFEGRARASSLDAFLDSIAERFERERPDTVYATGIGGLFLLALRARDQLRVPAILQGAVLWGLEHRTFARVMRGPLPHLLRLALRTPLARWRFEKRHLAGVEAVDKRAFFRGYAECAAFPDFFRWLRAPLLRSLEATFAEAPERLDDLRAWWGARDHVVGLEELRVTESALGRSIPCTTYDAWGHYPMLEDPDGWSEELLRAVA